MLRLGSESVLLTEDGPASASALRHGARVLALTSGKPRFVEVAEANGHDENAGDGLWLFCDGGDLVLGSSGAVVTSAGLRTGGQLLALRDMAAIGHMNGDWPRLEIYAGPVEGGVDPLPTAQALLARLGECSQVDGAGSGTLRVGLGGTKELPMLGPILLGSECDMEPGPVGWSWLRRRKNSPRVTSKPDRLLLIKGVLALWKSAQPKLTYELPIELDRPRWLSLLALTTLRCGFALDFRPRYLPAAAELSLASRSLHHGTLQGIVPVPSSKLVELSVEVPGSFVVVNNLLCAA